MMRMMHRASRTNRDHNQSRAPMHVPFDGVYVGLLSRLMSSISRLIMEHEMLSNLKASPAELEMALRNATKKRSLKSRIAGSEHASVVSLWVPGTPLRKRGQDVNRFSRSSNSVHPVIDSPPSRSSTAHRENIQTVSDLVTGSTASSVRYVVKVRVLHGIDLHVLNTKSTCQHAVRPVANITVNDSPIQSCTATQHARNHSIWKKHELKFQVHGKQQVTSHSENGGQVPSSVISMHVSLSCAVCTCATKSNGKLPSSVEIGEVGELQFPAKENENYEISRFFPVIRRQLCSSQSACVLFPAGKVKLRVRVEIAPEPVVVRPETIKRPPFALPTNFGEALQLKRKQLKATVVPEDDSQKNNNQDASLFNPGAAAQLLKELSVETAPDLIDTVDLKVENRVGEGIHSCVSRGVLRRGNDDSTRQVAAKEFRHQHAVPPVSVLRAFQQEYRVLERCRSQNGHQHVVELLGVTLDPRLVIIMEYFNRGSLAQCLQDEAAWGQMSIKLKAVLGLKIAQGIAWLHKHNVIHRDVKSHNILVDGDVVASNPTVKVGDLGSAVVWQQHEPLLLEEVGSSGYTAPEIFTHNGYDSKVDVWSFGVVLWELASASPRDRINPFTGMVGEEFVDKALGGCRPKLSHEHQLRVRPVLEKCWEFEPAKRPNMDEVVNQLEKLCQEL